MAKTPQAIIDEILRIEGEKYTNDPRDSGGPTKWGVTQAAYSNYLRRPATIQEIQNLSREQAFKFYWDVHFVFPGWQEIYSINAPIAAELMDTGVNMGVARAGIFLQTALNAFNLNAQHYPDLKVDGQCGQATRLALAAFMRRRGREGELVLLRALNSQQGAFYLDLATRRPKDEAFAYGWFLNRVE